MKRFVILILALLLVGCAAREEPQAAGGLEVRDEFPVKMVYLRRWMYGADAETEDAEIIKAVRNIIKNMELGQQVDQSCEDFTDIVIFHYEDGTTAVYEFEAQWYVDSEGMHYEVQGDLGTLRSILDQLLKE